MSGGEEINMGSKHEESADDFVFHNHMLRYTWKNKIWSKSAVILVGVLCVVLLSVIIGMSVKNTADRHQWLMENSRLSTEKEELQTNLTKENNQLNEQHDQLKLLHAQLQTDYNRTDKVNDHLFWRLCKLEMKVKENSVDVTLDPDTAGPLLILSADRKQVRLGDNLQVRPDSPKRFKAPIVLGKQGFSTGRFYYEVLVKGAASWYLGVTRGSNYRKANIKLRAHTGYWVIHQNDQSEFFALADNTVTFNPLSHLDRVGVFVDYEAGEVSFYNADYWWWDLLYSFKDAHFNDTIYPFFCQKTKSSPLIVTRPVSCADDELI